MTRNGALAKNSFALYLRLLFVIAISLYSIRVLLDGLGVEDYGIYSVASASVAILTFINAAISNSSQRFFSVCIGAKDWEGLRKNFSASLAIHAVGSLALVILCETLGIYVFTNFIDIPINRIDAATYAFHISTAVAAFALIQTPFLAMLLAKEDIFVFSLISVLDSFLKIISALAAFNMNGDPLKNYSFLFLVSNLITLVIYISICIFKYEEIRKIQSFEIRYVKSLLSFIGWSFIGNFSSAGRTHGINLVLNLYFGPALNAAHGVMTQVQSAAMNFANSFQQALSPQIYKSFGSGDNDRLNSLVIYGSKYIFGLMVLVAFPAINNAELILGIWLVQVPEYAIEFVKGILVVILIETYSLPLLTAAAATGKIKWYQIIIGGIIIISIPISAILMEKFRSPNIFIWVFVFFSLLTTIIRIVFLKRMINLKIESFILNSLLPVLIFSASAFVVNWFLYFLFGNDQDLIGFIGLLLLSVIVVPIIFYISALSRKEKSAIKQIFNEKVRRSE